MRHTVHPTHRAWSPSSGRAVGACARACLLATYVSFTAPKNNQPLSGVEEAGTDSFEGLVRDDGKPKSVRSVRRTGLSDLCDAMSCFVGMYIFTFLYVSRSVIVALAEPAAGGSAHMGRSESGIGSNKGVFTTVAVCQGSENSYQDSALVPLLYIDFTVTHNKPKLWDRSFPSNYPFFKLSSFVKNGCDTSLLYTSKYYATESVKRKKNKK